LLLLSSHSESIFFIKSLFKILNLISNPILLRFLIIRETFINLSQTHSKCIILIKISLFTVLSFIDQISFLTTINLILMIKLWRIYVIIFLWNSWYYSWSNTSVGDSTSIRDYSLLLYISGCKPQSYEPVLWDWVRLKVHFVILYQSHFRA